jgi:hypothetical protein
MFSSSSHDNAEEFSQSCVNISTKEKMKVELPEDQTVVSVDSLVPFPVLTGRVSSI